MAKGFMSYLAMKTDTAGAAASQALIDSDLRELGVAARKLANHAFVLGGEFGFGTSFLKWLAFLAAVSVLATTITVPSLNLSENLEMIGETELDPNQSDKHFWYLLILDRTNWKTNMLTGLLVPYIFFTLPPCALCSDQRRGGEMDCAYCGCSAALLSAPLPWVTTISNRAHNNDSLCTPDWLELPGAIILLTVVAPGVFADSFRGHVVGVIICLVIGCYLLQEHIRASGGFRNAFTKGNGVSNSIGILLLFIYPLWALVLILL
ncbi:hypothetical protein PR202_ga13616 [Eleusine coracana subsp. coracana]|uniref:Uncharacterized protein n=1 Tax=Eleusine coracana subsp. coracana TaxID=191504 RepID=A0AAV5CES1_ELECO|nr:hypothetical protein PR202_ga13616 [Eleusine coracana subsp. coracana]